MKEKGLVQNANTRKKEAEDIVYKASHDLKGPLRTIKSFTQLLDDSMGDRFSKDEKGIVGFIMEATDNLENLISKLIDYSRAGLTLKIDNFKIDNILQLLVLQSKALIDKTNATVNIICDETLLISADKIKLNILLENLLSNSLKFISKTSPPEITITVAEFEDTIKFNFKDNGIGIAADKIDIAFELFERVHGSVDYKGSRVGLATCQKIVEVHGGSININSAFGKYTEINFDLPKNASCKA